MQTKFFLEIASGVVTGKLTAARQEWEGVEIPDALREVDAGTYASVVEFSTANADGSYTAPASSSGVRRLSKFAFLGLLTPQEYASMFTQTDPQLVYGVAMFNAAADPFDIDNPLVAQMLDYCVSVGALTAQRRAELWAAMEAAASSSETT